MTYYSQSANPNATNSELDAKVIIKNYQLNSSQKDELIEQFVELQVDSMDTKTLVEFVTDILIDDYSKLTDNELKERVNLFQDDEQLYNELVENVLISELCEEVN
tara:strand:+ start:1253 stop:1567 length:315 start_codon:yes stop_codon:yes gene_type:complete